jgi:chromodomain-helicase-DNA-binding protein 1
MFHSRTLVAHALPHAREMQVPLSLSRTFLFRVLIMMDIVALTSEFDLNDADHESKIKELHAQLESLMLRRLKRDVLKSLPTKSERILRVEMSAMQTHYYKNILTKNFQALQKSASGNSNISLLNIG